MTDSSPLPAAQDPNAVVDHLFRREVGAITAVLLRSFGAAQFDVVDDAVQDALVAALRSWSLRGIPSNPAGWLLHVARNKARDRLRRAAREAQFAANDESATRPDRSAGDKESPALADDQLRLIFMCCHPSLSPDSRVALTLKCVGGFGVNELARVLAADERAVSQRLVRAKRTLREARASFAVPDLEELPLRRDDVLAVIYAIFNEGHMATAGEELLHRDLCLEAIRLCGLLLAAPELRSPSAHALQSMMLFQASRLPARVDEGGSIVTLQHQQRDKWDRMMISLGFQHFSEAISGQEVTRYHIEAELASLHAMAASYEQTDWRRVVTAYDRLEGLAPTGAVRLARAIAIAESGRVPEGLRLLRALAADSTLARRAELHAAHAELARRLGLHDEARAAYDRALALPLSEPVRRHLMAEREGRAARNVDFESGQTSSRAAGDGV